MPLDIQPANVTSNAYTPIRGKDVAATLYGLDGPYTNKDLYARYLSVCKEAGIKPANPSSFSRTVSAYGFTAWRTAKTRGWHIHPNWIYATS